MPACTFFGHRDSSASIRPVLRQTILSLIHDHGVTTFYVGHHGAFDRMAAGILQELSGDHPRIRYSIVLAYLPAASAVEAGWQNTLFPEGIERVPKRFAISWRNRWMLRNSDYVITHVQHPFGGAAQFEQLALRQGKTVIRLQGTQPPAPKQL